MQIYIKNKILLVAILIKVNWKNPSIPTYQPKIPKTLIIYLNLRQVRTIYYP